MTAAHFLHYSDLGISPIAASIGPLVLRWYSLGYIAGILVGWWYLLKLIARPGAPLARRHADDFVFYATLGILLGGRLFYVIFYDPWMLRHPLEVFRLWDGGMSFHGGMLGTSLGIWLLARKHGLSWLRVHDYVACCAPFGLFFVRCANFVNGELWGRVSYVPWAIVFPAGGDVPRHPSQLYEALLEGIALFLVLAWLFWRTRARWQPGRLLGTFLLGYGLARFLVEWVREPDVQLGVLPWGLTMGQTLTAPMILGGLWFIWTSSKRTVRTEPVPG